MGQLYDLRLKIEQKVKADGLDEVAVKGRIGLRAGHLIAFITPSTPDDPAVIAKMKHAIREVLNIAL